MIKMRLACSIVVVLILSACEPGVPPLPTTSTTPETSTLVPVTLGVGFVPNVQFAPFYVGMAKGFFADEGIELALDYGFENDYLKLVGANDLQFMVGSGDQVVLGQSQGLPVIYVMNWYTRYPVTIFARADAGIETPADLAGKRVGVPGPFGATYIALRAILEAAGLEESDIVLESIGFTQATSVSEGLVDAAADYAVNGPIILDQAGIETVQIPLDRYLQIPANGLITNQTTIDNQPDLVRALIQATLRSIRYTLDYPDEAFSIALAAVPEAGGENEVANRAVFDASLDYWQMADAGQPGATTEEAWLNVSELMVRIGLTESPVEPSNLYTNAFLPEASAR